MADDPGQGRIAKAVDRSFWWETSFFLQKYKLLGMVALGVAIAFGWQYVSPAERFNLLAQSQAQQKLTIDSVKVEVGDVKKILKVLTVIQCLDRSKKELAYLQLDCKEVQEYMDQTLPGRTQ